MQNKEKKSKEKRIESLPKTVLQRYWDQKIRICGNSIQFLLRKFNKDKKSARKRERYKITLKI